MRLVCTLEIRRSTKMIEVTVADDDVFDLLRIEARLFHSRYQNLFRFVRCIQRINDDYSLARCKRPGADVVEPDVVEIVKDPRRFESLAWNRRQSCLLTENGWSLRAACRA